MEIVFYKLSEFSPLDKKNYWCMDKNGNKSVCTYLASSNSFIDAGTKEHVEVEKVTFLH